MAHPVDRVIARFTELSRIPRCSGNEAAARAWVAAWADARGFRHDRDAAGNLRVIVPASPGAAAAPGVVLQGHLDMVCEKRPESRHDFTADPIRPVIEGEWLRAEGGTTLGADNGVAVALAMALCELPGAARPPLELLFTVEEESGLSGAQRLPAGWLQGRRLINLDSETEGVITIGCAGGCDVEIERGLVGEGVAEGFDWLSLSVGGLRGGHSGVDIHRGRGNAIRILARLLATAIEADETLRLGGLCGGTRPNAIPREARALVGGRPASLAAFTTRMDDAARRLRAELPAEPDLHVAVAPQAAPPRALAAADARALLQLLLALPHGVAAIDADHEGRVATSSNLALAAAAADGRLQATVSARSLTASGLEEMRRTIAAVAALAGAASAAGSAYPPWPPERDAALRERCREVYRRLFGRPPLERVIHAGLECAVIGARHPGMEMVSLGPTTEDAHSPSERLHLPSLARLTDYLVALLEALAADTAAGGLRAT